VTTMTWVYPALMGLAIATGLVVSRRTQSRLPLSVGERLGIALGAFCGGMIGAKLPFALMDVDGLLRGTVWLENGKTLMFGLVGGYLGVEVAKWAMHVTVKTGDSLAVPVAAAVGVGRFACLAAGCCSGTPTSLPWGCRFRLSGDDLPRHPTQVYEAAFHITMAFVLAALRRRGLFPGQLVKLYILTYLGYRFLTEFIRPEPRLAGGLTVYQYGALVLAPVFAFLWWRDARAARAA
jgi:phosphatidylglycerol:prolipoprotein diacylglycerol transferase